MYLLQCPNCRQIFKIVTKFFDPSTLSTNLITDLNGKFEVDDIDGTTICICCEEEFKPLDKLIKTDDWVADMIFKVKGKH